MNDDLISRQAAINAVISLCNDCDSGYCGSCRVNYPGEKDARKVLEGLASVQPEQKKGHWTEKEVVYIKDAKDAIDAWQSCRCSECGRYDTRPYMYFFFDPKFCSYCGAEMGRSEE